NSLYSGELIIICLNSSVSLVCSATNLGYLGLINLAGSFSSLGPSPLLSHWLLTCPGLPLEFGASGSTVKLSIFLVLWIAWAISWAIVSTRLSKLITIKPCVEVGKNLSIPIFLLFSKYTRFILIKISALAILLAILSNSSLNSVSPISPYLPISSTLNSLKPLNSIRGSIVIPFLSTAFW